MGSCVMGHVSRSVATLTAATLTASAARLRWAPSYSSETPAGAGALAPASAGAGAGAWARAGSGAAAGAALRRRLAMRRCERSAESRRIMFTWRAAQKIRVEKKIHTDECDVCKVSDPDSLFFFKAVVVRTVSYQLERTRHVRMGVAERLPVPVADISLGTNGLQVLRASALRNCYRH